MRKEHVMHENHGRRLTGIKNMAILWGCQHSGGRFWTLPIVKEEGSLGEESHDQKEYNFFFKESLKELP